MEISLENLYVDIGTWRVNVLLFLPIYHFLFFLGPQCFNWAVLLWGEVKCWSFSFSLFSGLLWNCTENNADYSRKTPASHNDWCKQTNHWWHRLFFHPPLLGHFNFYIYFLASFTKPPSWKDKKLMMFKGSEYCTLFFCRKICLTEANTMTFSLSYVPHSRLETKFLNNCGSFSGKCFVDYYDSVGGST